MHKVELRIETDATALHGNRHIANQCKRPSGHADIYGKPACMKAVPRDAIAQAGKHGIAPIVCSSARSTRGRSGVDDWKTPLLPPLGAEKIGDDYGIISQAGLAADLVILTRLAVASDIRARAATEAALFSAGRPALLLPPGEGIKLARPCIIGWQGSRARAHCRLAAAEILRRNPHCHCG